MPAVHIKIMNYMDIRNTGRRIAGFLRNNFNLKVFVITEISLILVPLALWLILDWHLAPADFESRKEVTKLMAQLLGGAVVLAGLYITWRRLEVAQEGQITERFTRAVDQLGSEKIEIRLGGIYALERIARDSRKDHWPIMEILTAFVRKNARWEEKPEEKNEEEQGQEKDIRPPEDIQAILTVIGRRKWIKEEKQRLNLIQTELRGANLNKAHLEGADLREAHLEGANLRAAHLEGANLRGAENLTQEQIEQAITDDKTRLPDYLKKPN